MRCIQNFRKFPVKQQAEHGTEEHLIEHSVIATKSLHLESCVLDTVARAQLTYNLKLQLLSPQLACSICTSWLPQVIQFHSLIHYTPSNPWIRCVAANILRQPSKLPCPGISSTSLVRALQFVVPP